MCTRALKSNSIYQGFGREIQVMFLVKHHLVCLFPLPKQQSPPLYTHTHTLHGHVPTQSLNRTHKNLGYLAEPRLTHVIIFCTTVFQEAHGPKRVKGRSAKNKRGTSYTIQRRKETRKQICIAWKRSASWFLPQAICIVHN